MRIASLLPAATEIAAAVGLAGDLVAVTFECDHPDGIRDRLPVVVDTALPAGLTPGEIDAAVRDRVARGLPMYSVDAAALGRLAPDLILTQDLCRVCALPAGIVSDALAVIGCDAEVLSIDPHTVDDVLAAIEQVGRRGGAPDAGTALVESLQVRLDAVRAAVEGRPRPRVLVLEWTDPPFLAGHWVPELVRRAGGEPVAGWRAGGRSRPPGRISARPTPTSCWWPRAVTTSRPRWSSRRWCAVGCPACRSSPSTRRPTSSAPARGWWTGSRRWPGPCIPTRSPPRPRVA